LALQRVGVQFGLTLPFPRVSAGALRLYQAERSAVVPPEHIINEALVRGVRHAGDGTLSVVAGSGEGPTSFRQQQVDESVPRLRLIVVVSVGDGLVGLFDLGDLVLKPLDLGLQL